jgi:PAS domain S-box-containing protein
VLPADPRTRQALSARLQVILGATFGVLLLYSILAPATATDWGLRAVVIGATAAATGGLMLLARRGRVYLAALGTIAGLWVMLTASAFYAGGLSAPAIPGYLLLVLCAAVLFGPRAARGWAAISTLTALAFLLAESFGLLPPVLGTTGALQRWAAQLVFLGGCVGLIQLWAHEHEAVQRQVRAELAARAEAEQRLGASEQRFRGLLERSSQVVALYNSQGVLRYVSPASAALLGYAPDEVVGGKTLGLIHPDDQASAVALFQRVSARPMGQATATLRHLHKNGAWRWIELTAVNALGDPAIDGIVVSYQDVTERYAAAAEMRRWEQQLEETQRLEGLGLLAGSVAHDFNNMLTGMLGHAELALLDLPLDSPARASVEAIATTARHASQLTRNVLTAAGRGTMVTEPLLLSQIVREVGDLVRVAAPRSVGLRFDLGMSVPLIEADSGQIRQVVLNLLMNAAEAIGEARGTVTVITRREALDAAGLAELGLDSELEPGVYARLTVSDTGCGMDSATLARIFDPFFTTKARGRGLGLAAVRGIVRRHGGALRVQSVPGYGTTFSLWFPASAERAGMAAADEEQAALVGRGTLLIIEHDLRVRGVLSQLLRRQGFQVIATHDVPAALERLRVGIADLSGALLDGGLPPSDLEQAAAAVLACTPTALLVLMSGAAADGATLLSSDGAHVVALAKPFSLTTLRAALQPIMRPA